MIRLVSWVVAAVLILDVYSASPGQSVKPGVEFAPTEFQVFAGLLDFHGVRPVPRGRNPDLVIIFNPNPEPPEGSSARFTQQAFASNGAVLLAADQGTDWIWYLPQMGRAGRTPGLFTTSVVARAPGAQSWAEQPECPFLVTPPPDAATLNLFDDKTRQRLNIRGLSTTAKLFAGRKRLVANGAATLRSLDRNPYLPDVVASLPVGTMNARQDQELPPRELVFALGSPDGGARSLMLADPSVFSNQMLTLADAAGPADNLAFADAVVRWMVNDRTSPTCYFEENGRVYTRFDLVHLDGRPNVPPPPVPEIDPLARPLQQKLTNLADTALDRFETDQNGLDRFTGANEPTAEKFSNLLRGALIGAAVGVVGLLLQRLRRSRPRPSPPAPPAPVSPEGSVPAVRSLPRHDPTVAVRGYVWDLFQAAGLKPSRGRLPDEMPRVIGPEAETFAPTVRILWEAARGETLAWPSVAPPMQAAQDGLARGAWRFASDS